LGPRVNDSDSRRSFQINIKLKQARLKRTVLQLIFEKIRQFQKSRMFQYSMFALIILNFFMNCLNFEILPAANSQEQVSV